MFYRRPSLSKSVGLSDSSQTSNGFSAYKVYYIYHWPICMQFSGFTSLKVLVFANKYF